MNQRIYEEAFSAFFLPAYFTVSIHVLFIPHTKLSERVGGTVQALIHMQNYSGSFKECHMISANKLGLDISSVPLQHLAHKHLSFLE